MSDPQTPEAEGLLERIADTALDDDYYVVRTGPHDARGRFNTVLTGLVLAVFALLVAVAAIQTRTDRPASQRERATLIDDVASRKVLLAARQDTVERLRTQVDDLQGSAVGTDPAFEELRLLASDRDASGPGVRVTVDPGDVLEDVTDRDLQRLVNALWYAGAEAVAVNGKRIGALTSIRQAGGIIKVNYQPIGPPYDIVAIGDSRSLSDRFEQTAVSREFQVRARQTGTRFDVRRSDDLDVEATPQARLTIRHATAIEGDA